MKEIHIMSAGDNVFHFDLKDVSVVQEDEDKEKELQFKHFEHNRGTVTVSVTNKATYAWIRNVDFECDNNFIIGFEELFSPYCKLEDLRNTTYTNIHAECIIKETGGFDSDSATDTIQYKGYQNKFGFISMEIQLSPLSIYRLVDGFFIIPKLSERKQKMLKKIQEMEEKNEN